MIKNTNQERSVTVKRSTRRHGTVLLCFLLAAILGLSGCASPAPEIPVRHGAAHVTTPMTETIPAATEAEPTAAKREKAVEIMDFSKESENVIYLAGGCFWGLEHLMASIPGVIDAESGYANGTGEYYANYQMVCQGHTGFRETVRVEYDPEQVSLDALLLAYFYVIDPTVKDQQGYDVGTQYQTGVYYTNEKARETVERIAEIEKGRSKKFYVEIGPLLNYYPAEEYHQNYLAKNPGGYCHIPRDEISLFSSLRIDPGDYQKPATEAIRDKLTEEQ